MEKILVMVASAAIPFVCGLSVEAATRGPLGDRRTAAIWTAITAVLWGGFAALVVFSSLFNQYNEALYWCLSAAGLGLGLTFQPVLDLLGL